MTKRRNNTATPLPKKTATPLPKRYSNNEIIELEHIWRIKLKESGFNDIEMWDNKPKRNKKKLKFIKGHIRYSYYKTVGGFLQDSHDKQQYYRVIGIFAHHAPGTLINEKYRLVLQDYVMTGDRQASINRLKSDITYQSLYLYIRRNFHKMLKFVQQFDRDTDLHDDNIEEIFYDRTA